MQIVINKKALVFIVGSLVFLFSILGVFQIIKWVDEAWNNQNTWSTAFLKLSTEAESILAISKKDNLRSYKVSSCTLYSVETTESTVSLYCSLFPSRYFQIFPWLIQGSEVVKPDLLISIPKANIVYEEDGVVKPIEALYTQSTEPRNVTVTLEAEDTQSGNIIAKIKHAFAVRTNGKEDTAMQIKALKIAKPEMVKAKDYINAILSAEERKEIVKQKDLALAKALAHPFSEDSSDQDSSPHFTEGLVYGLYLIGREESGFIEQVLPELEKQMIPFKKPVMAENENGVYLSVEDQGLLNAPQTKFPLCPIQELVAKNWSSPAIKVFLAYMKYLPTQKDSITELTAPTSSPLYDKNGVLLQYGRMTELDASCYHAIQKRDQKQIEAISKAYMQFVDEFFVYSANAEKGTPVIEGDDIKRGVVVRGLATDPNVLLKQIKVTQVKRSLFDGILWVYLYGK